MQNRSRLLARCSIAAGLVLTALPALHPDWAALQPFAAPAAQAMHVEVRGFSTTLLKQAAVHPVPMILLLKSGNAANTASVAQTLRQNGATNIGSLDLVHGITANVSGQALSALRYDTRLLAVQPDQLLKPLPIPHLATLQDQLAHASLKAGVIPPPGQQVVSEPDTLSIIQADEAQKRFTGRDVRVAVIDSGIDLSHPDLQGVMLKGADGKPLYKDFTNTDLRDTVGHGTACAGTIVAQGKTVYSASDTYTRRLYPPQKPGERFNDTTYFTFTGVAPGVKLMAAKVFDSRAGTSTSDWIRAIEWAIQNHADVISESWGWPALFYAGSDVISQADEEAVKHGITVVVSSGNAGPSAATTGMPANLPDVITVGASTDYRQFAETGLYARYGRFSWDSIAAFTSQGPTPDGRIRPDVFAPGEGSWATFPHTQSDDGPMTRPYTIGSFSGTSMAAPVTAGVAAMVINAYRQTHGGKSPAPTLVKQILMSSADDLGYAAQDQSAGRVNALRAVQTVTHSGSSILLSGPVMLNGMPGKQLSTTITVTNSGQTAEKVTVRPQIMRQMKSLGFGGTVVADNQVAYHFIVPAGINELKAAINFDSQRTVPLPGGQGQDVVMQVVVYDPKGNMVNWEQSNLPEFSDSPLAGSGYAGTTTGHPVPGLWTAVVSQAPRRDARHIAHYVNIPFTGRVTFFAFGPSSAAVTPATLTLNPGERRSVLFRTAPLGAPGVGTVTLHVREQSQSPTGRAVAGSALMATTDVTPTDRLATIPAIVTTGIAIKNGVGGFSGSFTGGVGTQGYAREYRYYTFTVPSGIHDLQVSLRWKHPGNLFLLGLLDPSGKINNAVDNALRNSDGSLDLTHVSIETFLTDPLPGTWRIAFMTLVSAGVYVSEPYQGVVVFNQPRLQASNTSVSARAGGDPAMFSIAVRNTGIGIDGYYSYATTDHYSYLALGGTGGTVQNGISLGVGATQALTYTTNFVPPGTREVISQAQADNSSQPLDVELDDSAFFSYRAFSQLAPVSLSGRLSQGDTATIRGDNLPIGQYFVSVSLPAGSHAGQVFVAASTQAYALSPQPWIKLEAQRLIDGSINQSLLVAQPGGLAVFHGRVSVPDSVRPGTYHARVYVYNFRDDLVGMVPITINVRPSQPAAAPTPDPLLATVASTQYFPEGTSDDGVTDQMDLVNPGSLDAHVQLRLLNDGGWTTIMRYVLPAHSRKAVNVQPLVGKNQVVAAVVQADQTVLSGRLILRAGAGGSYSVGTAAPGTRWYFADGYTVGSFNEFLTVVNPNAAPAHVHLHLVGDGGHVQTGDFTVPGSARRSVQVSDLLPNTAVSATLSSDVPVVAERLQLFGSLGQGLSTTIGTQSGSTRQYIDPGHLPNSAQGHIAVYNPGNATAHVSLRLLDQQGRVAHTVKLLIKAGQRANADLTASFHTADLGAMVTSDVPVVAEKAAYYGKFKQALVGSSSLSSIAVPAASAVFPGGTTAGGASDYLSLFNPSSDGLAVSVTVIYGGNRMLHRTVQVPAGRRISLSVSSLGLPAGPSSLVVMTQSGAPIYASQSIFNSNGTDGSEVNGIPLPSA